MQTNLQRITPALSPKRAGRRGRLSPNDIRDNRRRGGREGRTWRRGRG